MNIKKLVIESGNKIDGDGYIQIGNKYINYVIAKRNPRIYKSRAQLAQEIFALKTNFRFR